MARRENLSIACLIDSDIAAQVRASKASSIRAKFDLSVVLKLRDIYRHVTIVSVDERNTRSIEELLRLRPDVVFNLALSAHLLEPSYAGCLDILGIPYTGSGPLGLVLAGNKIRSRHLLRSVDIRVPRFVELPQNQPIAIDLTPPLIVKPASLSGCAGIYADSVVTSRRDVPRLARRIWRRFDESAVCDEFVIGREFRIGLIEGRRGESRIVGITEWQFGSVTAGWGFKTEAIVQNPKLRSMRKVDRGPAEISRQEFAELAATARRAMTSLGVRGYATIDVRVDNLKRVTVIDVNANPGLWSQSSIWSRPGFAYNLKRIVDAALTKSDQ